MQQFKPLPTREVILRHVNYDPETGVFTRRQSKQRPSSVGRRTGSVGAKGYRLLYIQRKYYMEHRIAWVVANGSIPHGFTIDHINRDKGDNRLSNLRLATDCENSYYRPRKADNKTGMKGVYRRENGKYRATITVDRKRRSLGTFATKEEAYAAYCEAAHRLHGEFALTA